MWPLVRLNHRQPKIAYPTNPSAVHRATVTNNTDFVIVSASGGQSLRCILEQLPFVKPVKIIFHCMPSLFFELHFSLNTGQGFFVDHGCISIYAL
jgi:hypothetical protein